MSRTKMIISGIAAILVAVGSAVMAVLSDPASVDWAATIAAIAAGIALIMGKTADEE